MLDSSLQALPALLASEKTFVDEDLLYVAGGLLVLVALGLSFYGMRKEDDFPSSKAMKGLLGVAALLVVITAYGAVESARFEQAERRAENEEAAKEANEATEAEEAAEDDQTAGEAAEPPAEAPAGGAADADGEQLFVDTGCGSCHVLASAGGNGQIGPNLDEVLPGQSAEQIRTSIADPNAEISEGFAQGIMPLDYEDQLEPGELDALAQYLSQNAGG